MVGASLGFFGTTRIRPRFSWVMWAPSPAAARRLVAVVTKQELLLPFIPGFFIIETLSVISGKSFS
jgi:hypothetical protein